VQTTHHLLPLDESVDGRVLLIRRHREEDGLHRDPVLRPNDVQPFHLPEGVRGGGGGPALPDASVVHSLVEGGGACGLGGQLGDARVEGPGDQEL